MIFMFLNIVIHKSEFPKIYRAKSFEKYLSFAKKTRSQKIRYLLINKNFIDNETNLIGYLMAETPSSAL